MSNTDVSNARRHNNSNVGNLYSDLYNLKWGSVKLLGKKRLNKNIFPQPLLKGMRYALHLLIYQIVPHGCCSLSRTYLTVRHITCLWYDKQCFGQRSQGSCRMMNNNKLLLVLKDNTMFCHLYVSQSSEF